MIEFKHKIRRFPTSIFGVGFLLFLCFIMPVVAQAKDTTVIKKTITFGSKPLLNQKNKDVYDNPDYFKNIPVARKNNFDSTVVNESFKSMAGRYQSSDFNYDVKQINRLSWWDRLKRRGQQFLKSILPDIHLNLDTLAKYFIILLGFLALAFGIYKLLTQGRQQTFKEPKGEAGKKPPDWIEKKLMDIALNPHLEKALSDKDYRLAIRYLHLINLKKMSEKGQIEWDYKKTNQDFLWELKEDNLKRAFAQTIRIYDYVWYGGFEVSENNFNQYRQIFETFKSKIGHKQFVGLGASSE